MPSHILIGCARLISNQLNPNEYINYMERKRNKNEKKKMTEILFILQNKRNICRSFFFFVHYSLVF